MDFNPPSLQFKHGKHCYVDCFHHIYLFLHLPGTWRLEAVTANVPLFQYSPQRHTDQCCLLADFLFVIVRQEQEDLFAFLAHVTSRRYNLGSFWGTADIQIKIKLKTHEIYLNVISMFQNTAVKIKTSGRTDKLRSMRFHIKGKAHQTARLRSEPNTKHFILLYFQLLLKIVSNRKENVSSCAQKASAA